MKKSLKISLLAVALPILSWAQGFTTDNTTGNLLDACGNNFIMKGINVPLAWYVSNVNGSIAALKTNTKSNCLRIVVNTSTADNDWQTCVRNCINNKMIPMVELHDVTGSTDAAALKRMGDFWAIKATFLKSTNSNGVNIQKHILINLANEWGTWQTATSNGASWRDAVNGAIKPIRDAGIKTTIVVDAVGYGQDVQSAKNLQAYGKAIQMADAGYLGAKANILFSIHMYCQWASGGDSQISILNTIKKAGFPVIVGEFGYEHDNGNGGVCNIAEQTIMDNCQSYGVGWLAWSQKGNGSPVEYLDLCSDWNCTQLSTWGNTVINGTNGTKTAAECSVFSSTCTTVVEPKACCGSSTSTGVVYCCTNSDPDGDGWGWENAASCIVPSSAADPDKCKNLTTKIERDNLMNQNISIFPNPSKDVLTISNLPLNATTDLSIYSVDGILVFKQKVDANGDLILNTSNLTSGIYSIKFQTNGVETIKRFVKAD